MQSSRLQVHQGLLRHWHGVYLLYPVHQLQCSWWQHALPIVLLEAVENFVRQVSNQDPVKTYWAYFPIMWSPQVEKEHIVELDSHILHPRQSHAHHCLCLDLAWRNHRHKLRRKILDGNQWSHWHWEVVRFGYLCVFTVLGCDDAYHRWLWRYLWIRRLPIPIHHACGVLGHPCLLYHHVIGELGTRTVRWCRCHWEQDWCSGCVAGEARQF